MPNPTAINKPGTAALLGLAVGFAMVGICTVFALEDGANPLALVTLRSVGTMALMIAWFRLAGVRFDLPRREVAIALAIGLPLCANNYLINLAIAEIPVPLVVLIFYLWPAITSAISWLLGRSPFRWAGVAGLLLAFAGVALALNVDFTAAQARGVWYALVSACLWSVTFLLMSHFFHGRDTLQPTFWMTVTATVVFVTACAAGGRTALPAGTIGWIGVAGTVVFYAVSLIGLFWASARVGPVRTGFVMNFEPVASVLLAAALLGQTLAPVQLAGAALVVAALFLFRPPS